MDQLSVMYSCLLKSASHVFIVMTEEMYVYTDTFYFYFALNTALKFSVLSFICVMYQLVSHWPH